MAIYRDRHHPCGVGGPFSFPEASVGLGFEWFQWLIVANQSVFG